MAGCVAKALRTVKDSVSCAMRTVKGIAKTIIDGSKSGIEGAATVIKPAAAVIATLPVVQWMKRVMTKIAASSMKEVTR